MLQYAAEICMPLIEWTCISALPTLMCIRIILVPIWSDVDESSPSFSYPCTQSLQWIMPVLILTSILTLITIVHFRDDELSFIEVHKVHSITDNNHTITVKSSPIRNNRRGTGIVMGSHLISILYMSISISMCNSAYNESQGDSSCRFDTYNSVSMLHLKLASFGGLAFASSNLYQQWHHRKSNSSRMQSADMDKRSSRQREQYRITSMQMTSVIYLMLLALDIIVSQLILQKNQQIYIAATMGLFYTFLLSSHSTSSSYTKHYAWQTAFTPGEWMIVSTLITSTIIEFFIQHIFHLRTHSLPDHIVVAHAGFSGCILGIIGNSFALRMTNGSALAATMMVVATTVGCLEVALGGIMTNEEPINTFYYLILPVGKVTHSIQWLVHFLMRTVKSGSLVDNLFPVRVMILFYWMVLLAISLPVSLYIASWTKHSENNLQSKTRIQTSHLQCTEQKRRVVIARKYFHLVAILLFAPITWLDRDMMFLSYVIALVLLLMIEMIRCSMRIDKYTNPTRESNANRGLAFGISSLNDFYAVFFDDKDTSANGSGVVVSHISLIFGCAFPLWIHQLLQHHYNQDTYWLLSNLLPHIGVIVLGIGDSAGAIGGLSFRRPRRWLGGSSRTLEGSISMLLSMLCTIGAFALVAGFDIWCVTESLLPVMALVLTEASTKQIDNTCLPIAGSTLLILSMELRRKGK